MKKKLLTMLLSACVISGMTVNPVADMGVQAEEYALEAVEETNKNFAYIILEDGTVEIDNYNGNDTDVVIPAEIEDKAVSSIGSGAFRDCSSINSITLPEGITSIGQDAFSNCSNLNSITLPESLTSIGQNAFSDCSSLNSITLPENVTNIGQCAFWCCINLNNIIIPESVTCIEEYTFWSCKNLISITIPDSVTNIGEGVFQYCSNLRSVTLPQSLTSIKEWTFAGCSSLNSITIPEGVTSIGVYAFSDCSSLSSITLPENLTSIGEAAFFFCSSLRSIAIPEGITSIENIVFQGCKSLSSVALPKSLTDIGIGAFEGCDSLSSITLPENLTRIRRSAFSIESVYYNGTKEQWNAISVDDDGNGNYALYIEVIHCTDGDIIPTRPVIILNSGIVELSTTKVTYNGKAQMPAVIVKDENGNTIADTDYTVQYADNINVGRASVKVTFKDTYGVAVTCTFYIVPKGTKISKVTAKKRGFAIKWKKQAAQTTGYEIQYSTNSKFNGAKTVGNIKTKKTSKTISKLRAKKKYYIRIRTYKIIENEIYYSEWSAKKSVKTKK